MKTISNINGGKCKPCPGGFRTPVRDYDYYIKVASEAVGRSNMLWLSINQQILKTLEVCQGSNRSLDIVADKLEGLVGKKARKNEPTALSNIRVAVKAIRKRGDLVLL